MPLSVQSSKFGLSADPYKSLKAAYAQGFTIAELHVDTMQWYIPLDIDWSKPPLSYKILHPITGKEMEG